MHSNVHFFQADDLNQYIQILCGVKNSSSMRPEKGLLLVPTHNTGTACTKLRLK
uniref:Uncharacterized protein n=1 Tax=Anguilla anguilla TaxID=7936 RepID=A0A0E9XLP4_ANGAN